MAAWPALIELIERCWSLAAERVHAQAEAADDRDQGEHGERRPPLGLASGGQRGDAAVRRLAPGHEVAGLGPRAAPARRRPRSAGRAGRRATRRHPRPGRCRRAGSGSGPGRRRGARPGAPGRASLARDVGATSVASKAMAPSRAGSVGRPEAGVQVLHRRLRVERQHRVLELVGPEARDDVGRDEHERVADRDLAAPDVGLQAARGQAALAVGVGQRREAGLADQVGLRGPHGRHVHLVAADHRDPDADRPVAVGRLEAEPVGLVDQPLVRGRDRLLEADPDPGRLVVVVLVADRLGGQPRRLERVARADAGRDEQVEVALRAGHGSHARLDHEEGVRRVVEAVVLGDEAEFQLESGGHAGLSQFMVGRRDDPGRIG